MNHVSVDRIKDMTMGIIVEHSKLLAQDVSSLARFKTSYSDGTSQLV